MNHLPRQTYFSATARVFFAVLAALILPLNASAQTTTAQTTNVLTATPQRWLFVFDLSSAMKKRLPATQAALKSFFASNGEGQLQAGDQIGAWTFGQKIHTGEFPLTTWNPAQAVVLTSNLMSFLHAQKYAGDSQITALQPTLGGVIANSERLTTVIFCDGQSEIAATPYDSGINENFQAGRAERGKSRQPFVVLLRTQLGKHVGGTVNLPPAQIKLPPFPPLPGPTNIPPVAVPVKPAPVVPDLVIVGKKVGTNIDAAADVTTNVSVPDASLISNAPPTNFVAPATNRIPAATASRTSTNASPTNSVAASVEENSDGPTQWLIYIGIGLAALVMVVGLLIVRSKRPPPSSLISSSMQNDPRRK